MGEPPSECLVRVPRPAGPQKPDTNFPDEPEELCGERNIALLDSGVISFDYCGGAVRITVRV